MTPSSTRLRALSLTLAAAGVAAAAVPAVAATSSSSTAARPSLTASIPAWAHGTPAAAEPTTATVRFALQLRGRDAAGLHALALRVSDPSSPDYRHFLTKAQYDGRFAPTAASATLARTWLRSVGLTVDATSPSRTMIAAHGTASAVAAAFHTSFARFRVGNELRRAPLAEPTVPAALSSLVAGVDGLAQETMRPTASPAPVFLNARPCSSYFGQITATRQPAYAGHRQKDAICGYTPQQIRGAYGVNATHLTGKGATVAIVDAFASPDIESDANTYSKRHGLPQFASGQFTDSSAPGLSAAPEDPTGILLDPQGWAGEETLDVEAVHAMAPQAAIAYYGAATPENVALNLALAQAVEEGKAQVVSNSYGSTADSPDPADQQVFDTITDEAASMGVTINFSSGDDGDEVAATGQRTADYPATSPGVTAVGGTTLEVNKHNQYVGETYWGTWKAPLSHGGWDFGHEAFSGAGGGGVSTTYPEPAWQKGVVPSSLTTFNTTTPGRVVPDLSLVADSTTGFLMGQTQTFKDGTSKYSEYRIGGTSLSCPLFSGLVALAVQKAGKGIGLVTPTLYQASKTAAGRTALFRDPSGVRMLHGHSLLANVRPDYTDTTDPSSAVSYSLRMLGTLGTLHRLRGYDDSTGLGTPKAAPLVRLLG